MTARCWLAIHCETALLDVPDLRVECRPSGDGAFRIVSCSVRVPAKRLYLLVAALAEAGGVEPAKSLEWIHFGAGPLQAGLEARVASSCPGNVTAKFAGHSTPSALFAWCHAHPVDVFVNISEGEGTPTWIMEAISSGIPVLGTAVGGNPKEAAPTNAPLLQANTSTAEIAARLLRFADRALLRLCAGNRVLWASRYDAQQNVAQFAQLLGAL